MQCISHVHNLNLCHCCFSCSDGGSLSFLFIDRGTISDSKETNSWPCSVKKKTKKYLVTTDCICYTFKGSLISLNLLPLWNEALFSCFSCRVPACVRRMSVVMFSCAGSIAVNRKSSLVPDLLYLSKTTQASSQTTYIHLGSHQRSGCCPFGRAGSRSKWQVLSQIHLHSSEHRPFRKITFTTFTNYSSKSGCTITKCVWPGVPVCYSQSPSCDLPACHPQLLPASSVLLHKPGGSDVQTADWCALSEREVKNLIKTWHTAKHGIAYSE